MQQVVKNLASDEAAAPAALALALLIVRWAFNARVDGPNTFFDRFWDQMILWLLAGRDFVPAQNFSLRESSTTSRSSFPKTAQKWGAPRSTPPTKHRKNSRRTEIALDLTYLKRLSEASGGRIVQPDELSKVLAELETNEATTSPATRLHSLWDRAGVFWTLGPLFAADWYLRRRRGLS